MSRSMHIARQTIVSLRVVLPNFHVAAHFGEVAIEGVAATTASVEYPAGTFTPFRFAGGPTGAIAPGGMLISDPCPVAIPNGARFWIRQWFSNGTGGVPFCMFVGGAAIVGHVDAVAFGQHVDDRTMGGEVRATQGGIACYPAAIVADSIAPSIALIGDSRVAGVTDIRNDATGDGGELARLIGPAHAYIGMGIPSDTAIGTVRSFAHRTALLGYCSAMIDNLGINDIYIDHGIDVATIAAARTRVASMCAPGTTVYGTTLTPVTTSTDGFRTEVGQAVFGGEAARRAFNAAARAGIPGEMNCIDLAAVLDPDETGRWPTNGRPGFFTPDGIHEATPASVAIVRANPLGRMTFDRR